MITFVAFQSPITGEAFNGGTSDWSLSRDGERVTCTDKGNHLLLEWTHRGGKFAGRKGRIKVPLTNISQLTEVDDDPPAPPKESKKP